METVGGGAYCKDGATLINCLITGNSAAWGGGVSGGTLYGCVLTGNSAREDGGGTRGGTLYNCLLIGNSAEYGGGSIGGILYNCTLVGNSAISARGGGGILGGELYSCIVYFNAAPSGSNYAGISTFDHSCTAPLPADGDGNISDVPLFLNTNDWSDLRLRFGSPGIDAGTNLSEIMSLDLDGAPRPLDGDGDGVVAFDMGAYEFDARSMIPPAWFTDHGLDVGDPHVVSGNPDHDPFTTFQEWLADTDPTNEQSFFTLEGIGVESPTSISFESSPSRSYSLWSTPVLVPADWRPVPGAVAIPGIGGTMTLRDATGEPEQYYRVDVNLP